MSPFAKLFRSTAFKLTFAILALSAIGSGLVLGIVAWQVTKVVDAETAAGIQTEATSLADQYELGGLRRLGAEVALRSRVPGPTLYLLTDPAGEPLAGNIFVGMRLQRTARYHLGPIESRAFVGVIAGVR